MRFYEISEAKMSKGVLSATKPNFDITCGFEVEVAISDLENFDYEEYFEDMGETLEPPDKVIDAVYERNPVSEVINIYEYLDQMEGNIPSGYRLATDEERDEELSEFEYRDNWIVIVDEDDDSAISIDITDMSDVEEWFPNIYSEIMSSYEDIIEDRIEEAKQDWIQEKKEEVSKEFIMGVMVSGLVSGNSQYDYVVIDDYHGMDKTGDEYVIEPDSSISPQGMEIVSPVFNDVEELFEELDTIFEAIKDDDSIITNGSTGLHINIGGFDASKLDYLKLLLFLGEGKIAKDFDREHNSMTSQMIPKIAQYFKRNDITLDMIKSKENLSKILSNIQDYIKNRMLKYYSVNFEKLPLGYIEFRSIGGDGYEYSFDEIELSVLRMIRAINIATSDDYHQEYIKKIVKVFDMTLSDPKKVGQALYPELAEAKEFIRNLYRFIPTDHLSNHIDFIVILIKAHNEFNDRNNEMLEMEAPDYTKLRGIYSRLKSRNLESPYYNMGYAKNFLKDKREFMPDQTYKFLNILLR